MSWRVGSTGLTVHHEDGSESWLPPDSVIEELPAAYTGEVQRVDRPKRHPGYANKMIQSGQYEDKGQ